MFGFKAQLLDPRPFPLFLSPWPETVWKKKKRRNLKFLNYMKESSHTNHTYSPNLIVFHQFSSVAQLCLTLCDPVDRSTPGLPVHHQLPEFTHIHVHWVGDAIQPSHFLASSSPPAFNLAQHQVFDDESVLRIRQPNYWSFSFSISPSNEYSGRISFRMDLLDLLAGTRKSLPQHHSSKASIL